MSGNLFLSTVLKVVLLSFIPALQAQTLKITTTPASPVHVKLGEDLLLNISYEYTGNQTIIGVLWTRKGENIALYRRSVTGKLLRKFNRAAIKDKVDLVLTGVVFKDNTTFEVTLSADDTRDEPVASIEVIVEEQPVVDIVCYKKAINESENVKCDCTTTKGSPTPWMQWYDKDGNPLLGDAKYAKKTLALTNIQAKDAGDYMCKATGGILSTNKTVTLYGPTDVSLTIQLKCSANGYPEPTYILYHNGSKITTNVNKSVYTISEVEEKDAGIYTCKAKHFETVTATFALKVVTSFLPILDKSSCGNCDNKWYIILTTLLCGILIGVALSFLTIKLRRRRTKQEDKHATEYAVPVPANTGEPAVYQELGVRKTNEADGYQSLRKDAVERESENEVEYEDVTGAGYQELNNPMGRTDENYQSLQKV